MATSVSWAQDVILCDLCEKPTQQFCNSCQVSLCDDCVGKHRDEFRSLSHEIAPFFEREIKLAFPNSQDHSGQIYEANCPHEGHDAEELAAIHKRVIFAIKQETQEIKDTLIKNYQKEAVDTETTISIAKSKFHDLKKQNKKYRQLWHKEVDNIFDKIDVLCQSFKEESLKCLELYRNKIRNLISDMTKTVQQNEKILKSNKLSEVTKYQSRLNEFREGPEKVNLEMPFFSTKIVEGEELGIHIGYFKVMLKETFLIKREPPQLLNESGGITIHTKVAPLRTLACVGEAAVWVIDGNANISRIAIDGKIQDTVVTKWRSSLQDISVSKDGELIYSFYDKMSKNMNGMLNRVRNGETETLITTPDLWKPSSFCCTRSGDILLYLHYVGEEVDEKESGKIFRYQQSRKTQEIDLSFIDKSESLFMTENNNGDICISNNNVVIVLDKTGEVRFKYDGTLASGERLFSPRGIVTDSLSQIIVTDVTNDCLHILDQNGRFLRYIGKCGMEKPFGLSMDSKGRLWVGLRDAGMIIVVEYL